MFILSVIPAAAPPFLMTVGEADAAGFFSNESFVTIFLLAAGELVAERLVGELRPASSFFTRLILDNFSSDFDAGVVVLLVASVDFDLLTFSAAAVTVGESSVFVIVAVTSVLLECGELFGELFVSALTSLSFFSLATGVTGIVFFSTFTTDGLGEKRPVEVSFAAFWLNLAIFSAILPPDVFLVRVDLGDAVADLDSPNFTDVFRICDGESVLLLPVDWPLSLRWYFVAVLTLVGELLRDESLDWSLSERSNFEASFEVESDRRDEGSGELERNFEGDSARSGIEVPLDVGRSNREILSFALPDSNRFFFLSKADRSPLEEVPFSFFSTF